MDNMQRVNRQYPILCKLDPRLSLIHPDKLPQTARSRSEIRIFIGKGHAIQDKIEIPVWEVSVSFRLDTKRVVVIRSYIKIENLIFIT